MAERIYVALDLETTGLAPESDEIIEIGAVKFNSDGREIDVFETLVNPRRPIPYTITRLCDISQEQIDAAPSFSEVVGKLVSFLEGCSPVGHNISFDLNFLRRNGVNLPGPSYDTYDLAKLLLPDLGERSLSAVAYHLGIPHPSAHRALPDARVAKEVFVLLLGKINGMDPVVLGELVRLTAKTDWWLGEFLGEMAQARNVNPLLGAAAFEQVAFGSTASREARPLKPNSEKTLLDIEYLTRLFDIDGPLAQVFPGYEQRPEQKEMMRAVAEALNFSQHLIVEAGTGTGKSMAYLLPAAMFACKNNIPVVVSTNTINLQEQLVHKDIPDLVDAIQSDLSDLKVATIKGRNNYLCLRRWETVRRTREIGPEVVQLLARIQLWLPSTQTGDRSELNLDSWELRFWPRVCAQSYDCLGRKCPYYQRGLCFLHRARNVAGNAHLIVTNHALLLSEVAADAQILPEYAHLIIDEAHHFEDVATDQMGVEIREEGIVDHLDQISREVDGQQAGFLPQLAYWVRASDLDGSKKADLEQLMHSLSLGVAKIRARLSEFFNAIGDVLQNYGEGQGEYDLRLRITGAMRAQPAWSDIEISCENLTLTLEDVTKSLSRLHTATEALPVSEALGFEMVSLLNSNEELREQIDSLVFHPDENSIHWLTLNRKNNSIGLHSAPLHVGSILQKSFYSRKDTLVLTGATLTTEGNFSYIKSRLGLEGARELLLGTSFDYQSAALIYLASDIPEPGKTGYQKSVAQALISLCRATEGRCLVLFTSHSALRGIQTAIRSSLEQDDILVLAQGVDGPPKKLLASLRNNPRTVLLGAASFWEGVDVVGDALSVLVIVRLPFSVPTDPVFAARSDTFDDPFSEYSLPKTAFKFKQGFGRLIRSKTDRGVMAVLDSRLSVRNYSHVFLKSLPPCRVEKGLVRDLPDAAQRWLKRE
ncbi:MAG: helicase C-terminal domain-containing protein [Dehalococcoidia bacterium]|nr:helicase C-terminal domain-containing protein [Dehalococcoidia bacterium]